jgi:hypothetical protein
MSEGFPDKFVEPGDYSGFSDEEVITEFDEVAVLLKDSGDEQALIERWYAVVAEIEHRGLDVRKG